MNFEQAMTIAYSLAEVNDAMELHKRAESAVRQLGCDQFLIGLQIDMPSGVKLQHVDSGYSERWQRRYLEKQYIRVDPLIGYCQTNTTPILWDRVLYTESSLELFEESRSHGLAHGVSVPVHESRSSKSMFSVARDQPIADPREQALIVAGAGLLANSVHMAMRRIVIPAKIAELIPDLSAQEFECLRYAALGKTNGDIAGIMNLAEPTVNYHLGKVLRKFGVTTRVQAVALAIQLRILT